VVTGTAALSGVFAADGCRARGSATGQFTDKNVGPAKAVSVTGATLAGLDAGNYLLNPPILSADITPATATVSGLSALDKLYDFDRGGGP